MKKAVLILALIGVLGVVWHSSVSSLDPVLLHRAMEEYAAKRGQLGNRRYLTVIDYRKSILQPRLFVVSVKTGQTVLVSRVSHAWKSGLLYASDFSNKDGSNQSSLGSFVTGESYQGSFGYSMRIDGITPDRNTNARSRAIVFHPDPGYRYSKGCFMTSKDTNKRLIDLTKGGSLVYVYR